MRSGTSGNGEENAGIQVIVQQDEAGFFVEECPALPGY
jgi:hypothetical protein